MNDKIIILDPGHGGFKSGTVNVKNNYINDHISSNMIEEEDINLVISSLIYTQLSNYNYNVFMTRFLDNNVSLEQRCKIANSINADIFVSIHCNAHIQKNISGMEIYHYKNSKEGIKISNILNEQFKNKFKARKHRIREANFYVLKNTHMPSILIELEYMSNENGLNFLLNPEHQYDISVCITNGIIQYLTKKENKC